MNSKKILIALIEDKEPITINRLSKKTGLNYRTAYDTVQSLKNNGIVHIRKAGNSSLLSLTYIFNYLVQEAEEERRGKLLKKREFNAIYGHLKTLKSQFILILFGSHARNEATKNSDIDLILISDDSQDIEQELRLLPLNIHLTQISYEDFWNMLLSREGTVVSEAIKRNIILFGTEDYYRFLNNAIGE